MLSKKTIIESYVKIIIDSLMMIQQSSIVTNLQNTKYIVYNIINAVIHVFHASLVHHCPDISSTSEQRNNVGGSAVESLFLNCQKACFCYLEYIEQMTKTNLLELDNATITSFVYKQSIPSIPSTIIQTDLLHMMKQITYALMAWDNHGSINLEVSLVAKIAICEVYLGNYIKLFYNITHNTEKYCHIADIVRKKTNMNEDAFFAFLGEYYNLLYKLKKQNKLLSSESLDDFILGWSVTQCNTIDDEKQARKMAKQLFT